MSTDKPLPEAVLERVRQALKAAYPGGCKMLSLGSDCPCILCDLDRIEEAAAQQERAHSAAMRKALEEVVHHADDECGFMEQVRAALASHPAPDTGGPMSTEPLGTWQVRVHQASHPPPTPEDRCTDKLLPEAVREQIQRIFGQGYCDDDRLNAEELARVVWEAAAQQERARLPQNVSIVRRERGGVQIEGHTMTSDWEIEIDEDGNLVPPIPEEP